MRGAHGRPVARLRARALYPQEKPGSKFTLGSERIKPFSADDISASHTGYFELTEPPGFAGDLSAHKDRKAGRPETRDKDEKQAEARRLRDEGMSYRDISEVLGVKVPTLHHWLKKID